MLIKQPKEINLLKFYPAQLTEESNSLTFFPLYTLEFLYFVQRVCVSGRTLQYLVRHITPAYDQMTK